MNIVLIINSEQWKTIAENPDNFFDVFRLVKFVFQKNEAGTYWLVKDPKKFNRGLTEQKMIEIISR